jgi:hypothetical protein
MKLRIDIEIEDQVAYHHFNGNKKSARAYLANELRYSVGLLESDIRDIDYAQAVTQFNTELERAFT